LDAREVGEHAVHLDERFRVRARLVVVVVTEVDGEIAGPEPYEPVVDPRVVVVADERVAQLVVLEASRIGRHGGKSARRAVRGIAPAGANAGNMRRPRALPGLSWPENNSRNAPLGG